ncbi:MAG: FHA domain-containing protein [Pirellulales bacterium]
MKVIFELVSESGSAIHWVIREDQALTFGQAHWADVCFPDDQMMSGQHFTVENHGQDCWIKDIRTTNGTRINHEYVEKAVVRHGDIIQAGSTKFSVTIVGTATAPRPSTERDWQGTQFTDSPASPSAPFIDPSYHSNLTGMTQLNESSALHRESVATEIPYSANPLLFVEEKFESGLHRYRSAYDTPDEHFLPARLLKKLSQDSKLVVILHYQKMKRETPPEITQGRPMFDWLPEEVARKFGPLVLLSEDIPDFEDTANESWDRDALLCFLTQKDPAIVIEHLAKAIHFNNQAEGSSDAESEILGYCWPSVLSQLLTSRDHQFVENMFGPDIEAVFMERPELPNSWQLLTKEDWSKKLFACGVQQGPVNA